MKPVAFELVEQDRGLGTAYERWCFYQRMAHWAEEYGVESALEGPVDGMAGIRGVHCAGLARSGVRVTAAVTGAASAAIAKSVYGACAAGRQVDVRVVEDEGAVDGLPPSDLVLVYHSLPFVDDWGRYLRALARLAKKVLIVATCNPDNWGFTAVRALGRLPAPELWKTEVLAPALWELGRVREHVYFDAPWWPDLPVAPGQGLGDRLKQMLTLRGSARFATPRAGAVLSSSHVYDAARWPYFGGKGWLSDLEPALLKHPAFEGRSARVLRRMAHLHAFVVDTRPRTPQAKRRLELQGDRANEVAP